MRVEEFHALLSWMRILMFRARSEDLRESGRKPISAWHKYDPMTHFQVNRRNFELPFS